jgi:hypothetical protein
MPSLKQDTIKGHFAELAVLAAGNGELHRPHLGRVRLMGADLCSLVHLVSCSRAPEPLWEAAWPISAAPQAEVFRACVLFSEACREWWLMF